MMQYVNYTGPQKQVTCIIMNMFHYLIFHTHIIIITTIPNSSLSLTHLQLAFKVKICQYVSKLQIRSDQKQMSDLVHGVIHVTI
jgi:hypothetical protein